MKLKDLNKYLEHLGGAVVTTTVLASPQEEDRYPELEDDIFLTSIEIDGEVRDLKEFENDLDTFLDT